MSYKDTIITKYQKFVDKRYFFKWFGNYSWIDISKEKYNVKKTNCKEYAIPNDNDYQKILNKKNTYLSNYEILKDSVIYHYTFYNGINLYRAEAHSFTVKDADPKTFKELAHKYAKDRLHIYHEGHKLKKRDVSSFKVRNRTIVTDKYGVYYEDKLIPRSHGTSFKFLNNRYGMDKNQMYFFGGNYYTILKGVNKKNAKTFKILKYNYAKDNTHIFYRDKIIKEVDYNSFHILKKFKNIENLTFVAVDKNNWYGTSNHNLELIIYKKRVD